MKRLSELINATHKHGVEVGKKVAEMVHLKQALERLNAERRQQLRALQLKERPSDFTMYDTITVGTVPSNPVAVAGYVGGSWPTFDALVKRFPRAKHLSIAVSFSEDADCLDIEKGDAEPRQAGVWARRQKARGKNRPCLYASLSDMDAVKVSLAVAGVKRDEVRLWAAHYTYTPHVEPGFDATQWTDKALGRNLDASLCLGTFL